MNRKLPPLSGRKSPKRGEIANGLRGDVLAPDHARGGRDPGDVEVLVQGGVQHAVSPPTSRSPLANSATRRALVPSEPQGRTETTGPERYPQVVQHPDPGRVRGRSATGLAHHGIAAGAVCDVMSLGSARLPASRESGRGSPPAVPGLVELHDTCVP